jgi:hypothetical protein
VAPMFSRLKNNTIKRALVVLSELSSTQSIEFAHAFWPDRFSDDRKAFKSGHGLLWKLRKLGYVDVSSRFTKANPLGEYYFSVSDAGICFLKYKTVVLVC